MGDGAKRSRHVALRRRRSTRDQALCQWRRIHRSHEQSLRRLRLRSQKTHGRRRVPFHKFILGLPHAPRNNFREKSAHRPSGARRTKTFRHRRRTKNRQTNSRAPRPRPRLTIRNIFYAGLLSTMWPTKDESALTVSKQSTV